MLELAALPPRLASASPMVVHQPGSEGYAVLVAAAQLNAPRVRETLELLRLASEDLRQASTVLAEERIRAASFALAALLPPVNIRVKPPILAAARSLKAGR